MKKYGFISLFLVTCLLLESCMVHALGKMWSHLKPTSFDKGDTIHVHVGQLWSLVRGTVPYDFYSLNWCKSTAGHEHDGIAFEDRKSAFDNNEDVNSDIHESPYEYWVGETKD